jgi:hypothetical protein
VVHRGTAGTRLGHRGRTSASFHVAVEKTQVFMLLEKEQKNMANFSSGISGKADFEARKLRESG